MENSINNITLRIFNGILIPEKKINENSEITLSINEFATIVKKFEGFGYSFEKDLALIIFKLDRDFAINLCNDMLKSIEDFKSDKNYTIFYKNFPEQVVNLSEEDIYLNQILHYWFGYLPEGEKKENFNSEPSKLVELSLLKLVSEDDIEKLFFNLISSNITLSKQNLDDLCYLSDNFSIEELETYSKNIKMKETLTEFSSYIFNKRNILIGDFNTATDILRFITNISNKFYNENYIFNTPKLNTKFIKFKYFNRTELNIIMEKLNNISNILSDMKTYKKPWRKFFLFYAKKINLKKYSNVKKAVDMLFGDFSFKNEKGYFNMIRPYIPSMNNEELEIFVKRFSKYSGDYVRNILSLLNISKEEQYEIILNEFKNCLKDVNTRVLFQLYDRILNLLEKNYLKNNKEENVENIEKQKNNILEKLYNNLISRKYNISNNSKSEKSIPRIVNSKGIFRKLEETIFLSDSLLKSLIEILENGILEQLKLKEPLGNVFIDESYKNIMITTSEKDSNTSLKPMTKGSKISFNPNSEVLRFFVGWKNFEINKQKLRVDIDLSAVVFNQNFEFMKTVAYYNQVEKNFTFSGDITDAPNGALEFIDISNLENMKKEGIRFILMEIRSYNGYSYNQINNVYAGVLELTKEEAYNENILYSSAISQGFQILSNNQTTNTILVDIEENEYIWIDMALPVINQYKNNNRLNEYDIASLEDILKYFVNKKYITMYDLLQLNAKARGTQVFEKENANIIFEKVDNSNNLPLNDILANYF